MKCFNIFFVLIFFISFVVGQKDSTFSLPQVEVNAISLKEIMAGSKKISWKSDEIGNVNLSEVLTKKGIAYMKNYGPNTLSTISTRGGSPSQTLVLWNNLPIQSPTLGLLDVSLINVGVTDEIYLEEGGNSTLWGSGAISAILGINTAIPSKSNFNFGTSIGSFGTAHQRFSLQISKPKWTIDTRLITQKAANDYRIKLPNQNIDFKQTNASMNAFNFLQSFSFVPKVNHLISLHYWYAKANRQVPPTLVQSVSKANQSDQSHRLNFEYRILGKSYILKANAGIFDEINKYNDIQINEFSKNEFNTKLFDFTYDKKFGKNQKFLLGTSFMKVGATTKGYAIEKDEQRLAFFVSHKIVFNKFSFQTGLRKEKSNNIFSPFMPSIGFEYNNGSYVKIRSKVNRNFRFPTLNDRYWRPGGNENLTPEVGWSQEIGIDIFNNKSSSGFIFESTIYNRVINNWIQWGKYKNDLFFSALNLTKVWSRGFSENFEYNMKFNSFTFSSNVNYHFNLSTHLKSSLSPKINVGDQLWYVPKHNFTLGLNLIYKSSTLGLDHHYFSKSYGINEDVPSYFFGNISLSQNVEVSKIRLSFFCKVNNYLNKNYFVIERRPLPGRYVEVGINGKIKLLNKN